MKIRRKKFIATIVVVTSLIIGFYSLTKGYEASIAKYPISPGAELVSFGQKTSESVRGQECLSDNVTDVHLLGEYEDSTALYQLWEYTGENGYEMSATLLFGEACGIAYDPAYGDEITDRIPLEGARSLTVQLLERAIEDSGGIENFEADLIVHLSDSEGGKPELTSVYVWALDELGVEVPKNLYTVRAIDERAPR